MKFLDLPEVENLRVAGTTSTRALADAITASFRNSKRQVISCIGAATINTAMKAIATASEELSRGPNGIECILVSSSWFDADSNSEDSTNISGIRLTTQFVTKHE